MDLPYSFLCSHSWEVKSKSGCWPQILMPRTCLPTLTHTKNIIIFALEGKNNLCISELKSDFQLASFAVNLG